tara:strand:+ start:23975 stop:25912 length:1938 start_codon:yes stop_codon:yes gene_type:complete
MYNIETDLSSIKKLLKIRIFEKKLLELFSEGKINGTTHTCIGQEEVAVSVMQNILEDDFIFSNHRGHGHYLARFDDMEGLFCEIIGKEGAVCNGVGGSQHIKRGNYFSTGIQGESIPVATGVALNFKNQNQKNLALAFIGDGTWGQGVVYEALNMASLWQVPLVIVCENNGISQTTASKMNLSSNIKKRAEAFGVDFLMIDQGLTVSQINNKLKNKFEKVRNSYSPLIVEFKTNRLSSHSKGDDTRTMGEIEKLEKLDWYYKLSNKSKDQLTKIENNIKDEVNLLIEDILKRPNVKKIKLEKPEINFNNISKNEFTEERILDNLNRSINKFMSINKNAYFIGEDIMDPYGGAFKVAKGLSTNFPLRTITTPISELGLAGVGNGLALCRNKVIVEFMFADFTFLAFDQIINFAAKTRTMYGKLLDHSVLFRCPVGGNRGYGPTHSQSIQKFFIGIPDLDLYELSPLHDMTNILPQIMNLGNSSMLFESKTIYPLKSIDCGPYQNLFNHEKLDKLTSHVFIEKEIDVLILCGGSMVPDCINAMKNLFLENEISVHLINPFKLYPFNINVIKNFLKSKIPLFIVEESTIGGTWFSEIASLINMNSTEKVNCFSICSKNEIIPSSKHLEEMVLVNENVIYNSIINNLNL